MDMQPDKDFDDWCIKFREYLAKANKEAARRIDEDIMVYLESNG